VDKLDRLTHQHRGSTIHAEEHVARSLAVAAAIAVSLLAVSGAGGSGTQQTPKLGGMVVAAGVDPGCLNVVLFVSHRPCAAQADPSRRS
jgi:hypothetical protein